MSRYRDDDARRPNTFEVDGPRQPTWTGLINVEGDKIYRFHPPLGFGHHNWGKPE